MAGTRATNDTGQHQARVEWPQPELLGNRFRNVFRPCPKM